jgi:hypothetical protein
MQVVTEILFTWFRVLGWQYVGIVMIGFTDFQKRREQ